MPTTTAAAAMAANTMTRIAALLETHPDLPAPYIALYDHTPHTADLKWYLHINGKGAAETQRKIAVCIIRTLGGKWDKGIDDRAVDFTQERDGLELQVTVVREAVCTRRVVGTETVIIPAVEATPEQTVEREVVEWDCAPVLAEVTA